LLFQQRQLSLSHPSRSRACSALLLLPQAAQGAAEREAEALREERAKAAREAEEAAADAAAQHEAALARLALEAEKAQVGLPGSEGRSCLN
jgi:hypothetical protein